MEAGARVNSGGVQTELKMCAVKLVDIRNIQGLNVKLIPEEHHLTGGESSLTGGDQETLQAQLKMSSVRLVDFLKAKADHELEKRDQKCHMSMSPNKSNRFDGDQRKLHDQLKIVLVRLGDGGEMHSRNATAEGEPEDGTPDHECKNTDLTSSSKSRRFDGDQETQLKTICVRLVDCRKTQKRKATAKSEPEDEICGHDSKNNDFIPSSKTSRFDGDQRTFEAQLKVCLVRLVDCGKKQSGEATVECEPEGESGQSSPDQEEGNTSREQAIKRKFPRKDTFAKSFSAASLSGKHQNAHAEEKPCGKEFSQRSQLRSQQREKP